MKKVLIWRFDELDGMPMQAVRLTLRTVNMRGFGEVQRLARLAVKTWDLAYPLEDAPVLSGETEPEIQAAAEGEEQAVVKKDEPRKVRPAGANGALDIYRRWARLPPSTVMVDIVPARNKKKEEVDWDLLPPDAWPWSASSVGGLGWDNPDAMLDVPLDFFFQWEAAALAANPGVWSEALTSDVPDADGKKTSGLVALY